MNLRVIAGHCCVWCLTGFAVAQEMKWEVPPAAMEVDFTGDLSRVKKTLTSNGLAWEMPVAFPMLRDSLVVTAKLPEAGEVSWVMKNAFALVDVDCKRAEPKEFKITLRSRLAWMGQEQLKQTADGRIKELLSAQVAEATQEAQSKRPPELRSYFQSRNAKAPRDDEALRQAYIDRRTIDLGKPLLLAALEKLIEERTAWATAEEQAAWRKASDRELFEQYQRLLSLDLAEKHLRKCGFELDTTKRGFDALIESKFMALHALSTGESSAAVRDDLPRLRKSLIVDAVCQYVPPGDDSDLNAQWFNGQRVGTSISGVPLVRVHGSLAAARGDHADWWTLVGFDEAKVQLRFADTTGLQYELYPSPDAQTCLRISAAGANEVHYSFELLKRSGNQDGAAVVVRESPHKNDAKFPF